MGSALALFRLTNLLIWLTISCCWLMCALAPPCTASHRRKCSLGNVCPRCSLGCSTLSDPCLLVSLCEQVGDHVHDAAQPARRPRPHGRMIRARVSPTAECSCGAPSVAARGLLGDASARCVARYLSRRALPYRVATSRESDEMAASPPLMWLSLRRLSIDNTLRAPVCRM